MNALRLQITPEWEAKTVRAAARGGLGLSEGQFKRAKFQGRVLLDGAPVLANARVKAGQVLELFIPEKPAEPPAPLALPLHVPYEDAHFLAVDKPAPLPSSSSPAKDAQTLENAVFSHLGCPPGFVYRPVNRLDKGTSGLMLVAKTAYAQHLLQRMLHGDDFTREYLAVLAGAPPEAEGDVLLPIGKADGATVRREARPDGKPARTRYRVLKSAGGYTLARLRLFTGRTHQIRVHMAALGCPVAGDFLYGAELAELPGRFALHSARCRVWHPIKGVWVEAESPLPAALRALLVNAPR